MHPKYFLGAALVALAACSGGATSIPAAAPAAGFGASAVTGASASVVAACPRPDTSIAEAPQCYALYRTDVGAAAPGGYRGVYAIPGVSRIAQLEAYANATHRSRPESGSPAGYGPSDFASAYELPKGRHGQGQTIGIVDFYDDPTAEADLGVYRSTYGLPECTTANGCFKKVNQNGKEGKYPPPSRGWAGEIALDIEMASAVCPNCKILLVEARNSGNRAENTAIALGADVVSNSWGSRGKGSYDKAFDHPGHIITVASGDTGYTPYPTYPDSYGTVVSVGGTSLLPGSNKRGWTESAWGGSTSECNLLVPKPVWQTDTGCAGRTETDVSAVADPRTGVAVYVTYGGGGWNVFGGTSASSPIVAGVYALAGNESSLNYAQQLYDDASKLFDVTSGSNGNCQTYICDAGPGYDGPTGNGTPHGLGAF
ncbi:MAG TPA: S8 family serine peptidase [Candidatus Tumulicola sp.]